MNIQKNNTGITLVSLVITIIVMLILAGVSLNMIMGDTSVLKQASRATISKKLSEIKEEFEMQALGDSIASRVNRTESKSATAIALGEDLKEYIPGIPEEYIDKIAIFNGNLVFLSKDATEEEKQIALDLGFLNISEDDYKYMYYMYLLEAKILENANKTPLIGNKLGIDGNIKSIAGITYGLAWYEITESHLASLGIDEEGVNILKDYAPFVVKYTTGEIVSTKGKSMYDGTENELWVYSFNNSGNKDEKNISLEGILSGVNKDSIKSPTKFGDFEPTTTYASNGGTPDVIQNNYVDDYTYDAHGGVILTQTTNILSLPIDQTKEVNKKISVNITFKADLMTKEQGKPKYGGDGKGGCLLAISDVSGQDVCSIRIRQGLLTVITFRNNNDPETKWSPMVGDGFIVLDISKYNNKFVNVNVVAERGGQTKVYINGSLAGTFTSGTSIFSYKSCVIGDLRSGRGMKFVGNVYNFSLYGTLLTEEQVAQNWNYTKLQLGTDEAGTVPAK